MPSRRAVLLSTATAAGALLALPGRAGAAAPTPAGTGSPPAKGKGKGKDKVTLRLPPPSGPYEVGTVSLRLVDGSRPDPWVDRPYRELMVSVRYPARAAARYPRAPHMLPGEAAAFDGLNSFGGVPAGAVDWAATRTHAHEGAPAVGGPHPVVLYSPGAGDPRALGSTLCDDLASRGYAVVTVDHTYDAGAVEFPGGRVETTVLPAELAKVDPDPEHPDTAKIAALLEKVLTVRVADVRFVLDRLPDALPYALRGALDFGRTGMFGQSAGGFTALAAMYDDPRVLAGADLDGVTAYVQNDPDRGYLSPVAANGLDRPFLLIGEEGNTRRTVPSWDALWRHSRGPRFGLSLCGAAHATYTDAEVLMPQLARELGLSADAVAGLIGTIAPADAITTTRGVLTAFFDRTLRGRDDHGLLRHPGFRYPKAVAFN
ncbi:alpha/beta hydrolase family protein [Streptomyces sp. CA-111067]|uniref:alpha/beta hydrolase family protein n=1 Tax=Streptomyces sp. CA-111067 TaxID=3240046 RepID=UPI003D9514A1